LLSLIDTYRSLCTEFYDLDKPFAPEDFLNYYLKEINKSALTLPYTILEPMCGTGRFLIPILEKGIDIEGTDASKEMLNSCLQKSRIKNLSSTLYFQRLQELSLSKKYSLIFIPSGSFGLITAEDEVTESLKRLYEYLLPGGSLFLEISTPYIPSNTELTAIREVTRSNLSKIKLITVTLFSSDTNIETTKCIYENIVNDVATFTETEIIKVKHYHIKEFEDILKSTGFKNINALKPYSDEIATDVDENVLFKCMK